ncbi:MAG: hypothetical protein AABZ17_10635 [Nitrospirota bacterium]
MNQEKIEITSGNSHVCELGGIIVTVLGIDRNDARVVVGRPGMPNSEVSLRIGGATLFETPIGMFEVRLLYASNPFTKLLLTEIAPRPGLSAGYVDQDAENAPFTAAERQRLSASLEEVRREVATHAGLSAQQVDFITGKLIEMAAAADRFGRKDWINWALGTLTSIAMTAALDQAAAKVLFQAVGTALSWIVGSPIKLLQ